MTLPEFTKLLETTGYPVAFLHFPKEEPHNPPFICYLVIDDNNFKADGKNYSKTTNIQVELYTLEKDMKAENKLETALSEFPYEKNEGYLEDVKMYMATYQLTI